MMHARGTLTPDHEPLVADGVTDGTITVTVRDRAGAATPNAPVQLGLAAGEPITINGQDIAAGQFVDLGYAEAAGNATAAVHAATPGARLLVARNADLTLLGARSVDFSDVPGLRLQTLLPGESADAGSPTGKTGMPSAQSPGAPFNITLRTVDTGWETVAADDLLIVRVTDPRATLAGVVALVDGQVVVPMTLRTTGTQIVSVSSLQRPELRTSATIVVNPAPAQTLAIEIPVTTRLGATFPLTVTARDAEGNLASGYAGTIHFSSTDGQATSYSINGGALQIYSGPVSFTAAGAYSISYFSTDRAGNMEAAQTLTFRVNAAPAAGDDSYTTDEDTPLNTAAPGVLGNDSDPDAGDTHMAVLVSGPSHAASFALNADGSFGYTPAAHFTGADSFTYQARDQHGAVSAPATVTITVSPPNAAPAVALNTTAPNPTNRTPIQATAQFSKNVSGFTAADIVVSNATIGSFVAVDGDTYTFTLTPLGQGLVTADVPAGAASTARVHPTTPRRSSAAPSTASRRLSRSRRCRGRPTRPALA